MIRAVMLHAPDDGSNAPRAEIVTLAEADLAAGEVTVRVAYSTLNYKDALALTGRAPVVRSYPMVPGIDFAGEVQASDHPDFAPGDQVIANGWGMGESVWGGYAQRVRVPARFLLPRPAALTARQAMCIGTAGYTAMLCMLALEREGVTPDQGEILVTGANGGVGNYAIAILAQRGFTVCAATGRPEHAETLKQLGATSVIARDTLSAPGKPLAKERWAGAIDAVGSHTLANVCASIKSEGTVAACGMAQGLDFPGSVAPFILRGVRLIGINSVYAPQALRRQAWQALAALPATCHDQIAEEIRLDEVMAAAPRLLAGQIRGRVVVNVNA